MKNEWSQGLPLGHPLGSIFSVIDFEKIDDGKVRPQSRSALPSPSWAALPPTTRPRCNVPKVRSQLLVDSSYVPQMFVPFRKERKPPKRAENGVRNQRGGRSRASSTVCAPASTTRMELLLSPCSNKQTNTLRFGSLRHPSAYLTTWKGIEEAEKGYWDSSSQKNTIESTSW